MMLLERGHYDPSNQTDRYILNTFFFQRIVTVVIYFIFYKVDYCKLSVLLVVLQFGFYLVETCWPSYISR